MDIMNIGIVTAGILVTLTISYYLTKFLIVSRSTGYLPGFLSGKDNLYLLLIALIIIALADFYFVSFIPVIVRISEENLRYLLLGIFFFLSLIVIPITYEIKRVVLDAPGVQISLVERNRKFLGYSFQLIVMQEIIVACFYCVGLITLSLGVDMLPGEAYIFNIFDSEKLNLNLITDSFQLSMILILAGIKGAFLILHHGSLIVVFITLYVIFDEWNKRTKETPINYFTIFTFGFVIQGMGQIIQSVALIYIPYCQSTTEIPNFLSLPILLGSLFAAVGIFVYYISFMLAALSLLNNIHHMLLPPTLVRICKVAVIILPLILGLLYAGLALLASLWFVGIGGNFVIDWGNQIEELIHLIDIPAMILLPFSCGLFFLIAYFRGKGKAKGQELGRFTLWTFLSLFLIFGAGNNTMSSISWFGMLHAPLNLLGAMVLLYGLSRVADHASRHRRVVKYIRENPEDFAFLSKLGDAERKIQVWSKVDNLVKTGVIKPLVPTETPPDETKVAAEINSYMAEIAKTRTRVRKRTAISV